MSRQTESWVYMQNGQLMLHIENDGYAFLRHGAEAIDRPVSLGELQQEYPQHYAEALEKLRREDRG